MPPEMAAFFLPCFPVDKGRKKCYNRDRRGAHFNKEVFILLINKEIYNPIELGNGIPDEMFKKYIDIRDKQYKLIPTMPELTTEVKSSFYESHKDVPTDNLDKIWTFMYPMVARNEALAQFILDNGGEKSNFFFPWVMSVATSPSEALELSYNSGRNLLGEWVANIPETDEINFFVHNLPTLAYNRERQFRVADLVTTDIELSSRGGSKVIDLGAGQMAWARHHGFKFRPRRQQIIACDKDPSINPAKLFGTVKPDDIGLTYKQSDIMAELHNTDCADASFVILQGVASYYPLGVFREAIVKPVYANLRIGGSFFFDLQLNHISYEWSVKVFGWPEMELPETASDAINTVEVLRKDLWNDGMKFQAEYMLDTYSASPLSVMILFTKI